MYLDYFETTAEDFLDQWPWDEALKLETCKPVAPNGKCRFDVDQTQKMIDLAWFDNPRRPVDISIWDEETKRKMRKPVLANGFHRLHEDTVRNLILFASLY
jgi:hypothetical protein